MKDRMLKKVLCGLLAVITSVTASALSVASADEVINYARSETTSAGGVLIGGKYIEVGISTHGSFGTKVFNSSDFHNNTTKKFGDYLGLIVDSDGWNSGKEPTTGDFFTPGSPEECWTFGYKIGEETRVFCVADMNGIFNGSWKIAPFMTDFSNTEKGKLSAQLNAVTIDGVELRITYSFGTEDKQYLTTVEVKNKSSREISDIRFARSFDPDQDAWYNASYDTYNKVICNPDPTVKGSTDNYAMVVARGAVTLEGFYFLSFDNRARATSNYFSISGPYEPELWNEDTDGQAHNATDEITALTPEMVAVKNTNGYILKDSGIAITMREETLASGADINPFRFYSSLDPNVEEALGTAKEVNSDVLADLTNITIQDADSAYYYALFDSNNEVILKKWTNNITEEGTVVFDGLLEQTEYIIKIITSETYEKGIEKAGKDEIQEVAVRTLHRHINESQSVQPTCSNPGYTLCVCADCGEKNIQDIIPALDHVYEVQVTEATCQKQGYTANVCKVCGESHITYYLAKKTHEYTVSQIKEPTCCNEGYTVFTCKNCGESYNTDYTGVLNHSYVLEAEVAPTCLECGYDVYRCTRCDSKYTESVGEVADHNFVIDTTKEILNQTDYETFVCSYCGETRTHNDIQQKEHNYQKETIAPTCERNGYTVYRCADCDDEYIRDITPAISHNYEICETVAPTCSAQGYTLYKCIECKKSYAVDFTARTAHNYIDKVVEPTCTSDGYTIHVCSDCGQAKIENIKSAYGHIPYELIEQDELVVRCRRCVCRLDNLLEIARDKETGIPQKNIEGAEDITINFKQTVACGIRAEGGNVVYTSSDENVATVDDKGIITAKGRGTAVITARIAGTDLAETQKVTVKYSWWQCIHYLLGGCIWYFRNIFGAV